MNFKRDLLLIDLEMTGLETSKHEIIQIGSLLLDRKTLREKQSYMTYVASKKWENRDPVSMKINGIQKADLIGAPSLMEVLGEFVSLYGYSSMITVWGGTLDTFFLKAAFEKCKLKYGYDYHVFNIWSLAYPILAKQNKLTATGKFSGFGVDQLLKKYKIKVDGKRHDALTDCRIEAEILRHIMKEL